ncbi:MAG: hypothetical protein EXS64_01565 [Candidatus Latescibacteria bacterium]|nr:hypothetical protein [Candidatus Latescibacterota bacterium]
MNSPPLSIFVLFSLLAVPALPSPIWAADLSGYVGAEACRPCHQAIYEKWRGSAHSRAMEVPSPATIKGDFEKNNVYTYGDNTSRMEVRDGRYWMTTNGPGGKPATYEIAYTLGARQQQTYLARMPGGRLQILPTIYDITHKRWFDAAEGVIRLGRPLRPDDYYYWSNPGRAWNSQCAECHATGVTNRYDPATDPSSWTTTRTSGPTAGTGSWSSPTTPSPRAGPTGKGTSSARTVTPPTAPALPPTSACPPRTPASAADATPPSRTVRSPTPTTLPTAPEAAASGAIFHRARTRP